jgi:hypothetical protein
MKLDERLVTTPTTGIVGCWARPRAATQPRCQKCDEIAPLHSITLIGDGKERWRHREAKHARGLEVDRHLVLGGACTGRSAGLSPFRMRST